MLILLHKAWPRVPDCDPGRLRTSFARVEIVASVVLPRVSWSLQRVVPSKQSSQAQVDQVPVGPI